MSGDLEVAPSVHDKDSVKYSLSCALMLESPRIGNIPYIYPNSGAFVLILKPERVHFGLSNGFGVGRLW